MRLADLELLVSFLNTRDHADGPDAFDSAAGVGAWAATAGVAAARVTEIDRRQARELREALRATVAGATDPTGGRLADAGRRHLLRAGDPSLDEAPLVPVATGVQATLGRVTAAVALAVADGSFVRLKVCHAPDCGWAFIDESRNRSRRWCEMRSCGNQHKVRAYRDRQRTAPRPAG